VGTIPEALRPSLAEYRDLLVRRFGDRLISLSLFGSRARGDASPDSDVDVAVIVRDLDEAERVEAIDLAFDAWARMGRVGPPLSPLVWSDRQAADYRRRERRLALDIEREGIAV
jgi:uncharacterized protein